MTIVSVIVMSTSQEKKVKEKCSWLIFLTLKHFQENFKVLYGLVFQFVVSILSLSLLTIMSPSLGVVRWLSLVSLVSLTITVLLVSVYCPELSNLGIYKH